MIEQDRIGKITVLFNHVSTNSIRTWRIHMDCSRMWGHAKPELIQQLRSWIL